MSSTRSGRRRFALLATLVLAACAAQLAPAPAYAGDDDHAVRIVEVPCPGWVGSQPGFYAAPLGVIHAQRTFLTSESRTVGNELDTPATATFTSQTSRTFSIASTGGVTFTGLFGFLSASVSQTITNSTTTMIGVSAQATVPPHGQVYGDYGVEAYDVRFDAYKVQRRQNIGGCWVRQSTMGYEEHRATAPTNTQGWRLRQG